MHRRFPAILSLLTAWVLLSNASAEFPDGTYTGSCSVEFQGDSNLHAFTGTIARVPLSVTLTNGTLRVTTNVKVTDLDTDKPTRDRQMWKMFQSDQFPHLTISVNNAPLDRAYPGGGKPGKLPVTLSVAGLSRTVTGETRNVQTTAKGGSFDLALTLSLKDLGLKAPRALAGTVRVKDTVTVLCKVTLSK